MEENEDGSGTFIGDYLLSNLHSLLDGVYLPLLKSQKKKHYSGHVGFLGQLKKFSNHLHSTMNQLDEGVNLKIPEIKTVEAKEAVKDEKYVEEIDKKFEEWSHLIRKLLEQQSSQRRPEPDEGPLAEIEFWRQRTQALATLWDQLNDPKVKYLAEVLEISELSQNLDSFQSAFSDLTKVYMKAQDNVKFLETLERHFKNINRANDSLLPIIDTLPSMMRALDMVWTISRHYNTEKQMQPLLVLIKNEICEKVLRFLNIESSSTIDLFYDDPEAVIQKLEESRMVLHKWKETYFIQHKKISEKSEGISPWDFDRDKLFERTEFIKDRCTDLLRIVQVIQKHKEFLGPKMVLATGDKQGVNQVLGLVRKLMDPIKRFNGIFKIVNLKKWNLTMKLFDKNCQDVEKQIISFVDDSFSRINSAEGAFKLLRDVQIAQFKGQYTVDRQVITTSVDSSVHLKKIQILDRFEKEVRNIQDIFDNEHLDPPGTKNMPKVAGAIFWAESLFLRIFTPLDTIDRKILDNEKGHRVKTLCQHVGRALRVYQIRQFKQWKQNVESETKTLLERNILTTKSTISNGKVNFSPELMLMIQETKYLGKLIVACRKLEEANRKRKKKEREQIDSESSENKKSVGLTFWKSFEDVPRFAQNVALQEAKYHHYISELNSMLIQYKNTLDLLEKPEKYILKRSIFDLEKKLNVGFKVLNWNSLGISGYISSCNKHIQSFQNIVKKLQKNAQILKGLIIFMKNETIIVDPNDLKGKRYELTELYELIEKFQKKKVNGLKKKYKTITQTLLRIRGDLVSSNVIHVNEKEIHLGGYYGYWERKIYSALFGMVTKNLRLLQNFRNTPEIVEVKVSLLHQEIYISPNRSEVINRIDAIAKNILQSTKNFIRWIPGGCEPITVKHLMDEGIEDKEAYLRNKCSFFSDIYPSIITKNQKEQVVPTVTTNHLLRDFSRIGEYTQECMDQVDRCVEAFEKFSKYWKQSMDIVVKKFGEKDHKFKKYDRKIEHILKDIENTELSQNYYNRRFVSINFTSLRNSMIEHMNKWIQEYGKLLRKKVKPVLDETISTFNEYHRRLDSDIQNIDDLKNVLMSIKEIFEKTVDIERQVLKIQSCYTTIRDYKIDIPENEIHLGLNSLKKKWKILLSKTKRKEKSLGLYKSKFTKETKNNVTSFFDSIDQFQMKLENEILNEEYDLETAFVKLKEIEKDFIEMQKNRDYLVQSEKLFDLPITSFPKLVEIENNIKKEKKIFEFFEKYKKYEAQWSETLFKLINPDEMKKVVKKFLLTLKKLSPEDKETITFEKLQNRLLTFEKSIPLFLNLRSDALKNRHWDMIMEKTGVKIQIYSDSFTLKKLMKMKVHQYEDDIAGICYKAQGELRMEELLRDISEAWRNRKFNLKEYIRDNRKRGWIIVDKDEVIQFLDDDTLQLSSVSGSQYIEFFEGELRTLERTLSVIGEVIDLWLEVQQLWINLEVIFVGSRDIREQLPEISASFDEIDEDWSKTMLDVTKNPNIKEAAKYPGRKELLFRLKGRLQNCQKGLSNYLQSKREIFPRFYYLSDEELLSILGSSDTKYIQLHISKMYPNCSKLILKRNSNTVVGMESAEGEQLLFKESVQGDIGLEQWLNEITLKMKSSLRKLSKEAIFYYPRSTRIDWIMKNLGMVGLLGCQVWWTWEVEDCFQKVKKSDKNALKSFSKECTKQIEDLVTNIRKTDLSIQNRKKLNTSIIIDVHSRDIVDLLVRDSVLDKTDFAWESQMRYYWDRDEDTCVVNQCTGDFEYGYEYQGINGRLVITPLTDRCFMTLTQSLSFHLGGSPAGPAGTGKTESVKDLAKALGRMCVVFNCNQGLDNKTMSRLFSGLCQNGSFGCFDEFNRIELSVLSVIATQIRTIQDALNTKQAVFRFDDQDIKLNKNIGVFVTMNPGYAGRVELPDNLKALFRPCVMVVPNNEIICEILLFSEGFLNSRKLSRKMVKLYNLAEGQLSKQKHYDWGLRAIKSVLTKAGQLKVRNPYEDENKLLMKSLYDMNIAKFIFEDRPLFEELLNDLFVTVDIDKSSNQAFYNEIRKCLKRKDYFLLHDENQVEKVIQLCDTLNARHSTMIVGGTCGGKSVVIDTLAEAQTNLGYPTSLFVMNPKAQTVEELYGVMNKNTKDWEDGLLSNIFREVNIKSKNKSERKYIVFDGDVDPVWVESMNSVMDDNKLLTLPNGERISLLDQCKLLFEVGNLNHSSPATVSRCGMVFVDPKNLGYVPYFHRWLKKMQKKNSEVDEEFQKNFFDYFDRYAVGCIEFVERGVQSDGSIQYPLQKIVQFTDLNMCAQLCTLCESMIKDFIVMKLNPMQMESLFMFCVVWSIGGTLEEREREKFDRFLKTKTTFSPLTNDEETYIPAGTYPSKGTLFDYYINSRTKTWDCWKNIIPTYKPPESREFSKILVPTMDTVRYSFFLQKVSETHKPVLFVGIPGTAKTCIINNFIERKLKSSSKNTSLKIHFSSRTTSLELQRTIEDHIEKRLGDRFGPKDSKHMYIFIDELSMPKEDLYGTQQPIALLKFLFEKNGFYERRRKTSTEKIPLIQLQDVDFVCAMGPPGFSTTSVDPRFISKYSVFNLTFPSEESIFKIYSSILSNHLNFFNFPESVKILSNELTNSTILLHKYMSENLLPTPTKFHYIFNLRELSRVFEGLCLSTTDNFSHPWKFVKLWRNECCRVYVDRLIENTEKQKVKIKIDELAKRCYSKGSNYLLAEPLLYGDFEDLESRESAYNDLDSFQKVSPLINTVMEEYNLEAEKPLNLVMFDDAIKHLLRIYRIIKMDRGNALLVGVGGSGKKSLTRLAAHLAKYELFSITLSRNYNEKKLREDLKNLFRLIGIEGKKTVFLFPDTSIVEECFLEYINNMLTSGMVYALFDAEEKNELISQISQEAKEMGIRSHEEKWSYFIEKCRKNLHVVLAMSPGKKLRDRCVNFPGIVNNTTIDWFQPWPEQALKEVSLSALSSINLKNNDINFEKAINEQFVQCHISITKYAKRFFEQQRRNVFITPKNFLDFLNHYNNLLIESRRKNEENSGRLSGGLNQLIKAKDDVAVMQRDLHKTKEEVEVKQRQVTKIQMEINEKQREVTLQTQECKNKERELNIRTKEISEKKDQASALLTKAEPLLINAERALQELNKHKSECQEMKSFRNPHIFVKEVGNCLVLLMSKNPREVEPTWKHAQKIMTASSFISDLINFNKKRITEGKVRKIREIMKRNGKNFNSNEIQKQSKAASVILTWIESICDYFDIFSEVKPLRHQLEKETEKYDKTQMELKKIQEKLSQLQRVLKNLDIEKANAEKESERLLKKSRLMKRKLFVANTLINGLSSERERWSQQIEIYKQDKVKLIGNCLIAAGFLAYLGPFNMSIRKEILKKWHFELSERNIPVSEEVNLKTVLTDDVEIAQWESEGLPSDEMSVQNGMLTLHASRFPLCIDPQLQALNWIKKRWGKDLVSKNFNEEFMKHIEGAIRFGNPFLFEDIDEYIDPVIEPVLDFNVQGKQRSIILGSEKIDVDSKFKMFMCTRLSNPYYSPEIQGKTVMINYSVTFEGLQEQLLSEVVKFESRSLENDRVALIHETSENKKLLQSFERKILQELNVSKEISLLDNVELIEMLEETRKKVVETNVKLKELSEKNIDIKRQREMYRKVAKRGAVLFFVIASLSSINGMYEYSLSSFMKDIFIRSLERSKKTSTMSIEKRLDSIISHLTYNFYSYTCNGLFEKDKLTFSTLMCLKILQEEEELSLDEIDFFMKGNISLRKPEKKNPFKWIKESGWKDLLRLVRVGSVFSTIINDLTANEEEWKKWSELENPENSKFPKGYNHLSKFQKLCIIRCFRVDRVIKGVQNFIMETPCLGPKFVSPPVLDYLKVYRRSVNTSPIICLISHGYDPAGAILKLSERIGQRCYSISLGQGVGEKAKELILRGIQKGYWILLQNCHLLVDWLKQVEKILGQFQQMKVHAKFRLWMTTALHEKFPCSILQRSLKIVTEPPNSLKLSLESTYASLNEEQFSGCDNSAFKPLVFVLTYFQSVLQERKKYGKIGWNVQYDFNKSDFHVCFNLLKIYLQKNSGNKIPWSALKYLIGEVMYGGRVTDEWDRRVMMTYLNEYMGEFLFDTFQPFHFFYDKNFVYRLPKIEDFQTLREKKTELDYSDYMSFIQSHIRLENSPRVIGLNDNAEISYLTSSSQKLWNNLVLLQNSRSSNIGKNISVSGNVEKMKERVSKLIGLIPSGFDRNTIAREIGIKPNPMEVVLLQELESFNILVDTIRDSIIKFSHAINGKIGMNLELEELGNSLMNGFVPEIWKQKAPETSKNLSDWLDHLIERRKQYERWVNDKKPPRVIWLSGLHVPQGFLTSVVQVTCKKKNWPLDKVVLFTKITDYEKEEDIKEDPEMGCYVRGLFLEGASWDKKIKELNEQTKKVLLEKLPIMKITPIERSKLKLQNTFKTPVYVTPNRNNRAAEGICFHANLKTSKHSSLWVLSGVALLMNE